MTQKTIVVGLDGSELSFKALDRAIEEANCHEVNMVLVSVAESLSTISLALDYGDLHEKLLAKARSIADEGVARVKKAGHTASLLVEAGRPAMVIADTARKLNADEIVVGSLGKHAMDRMLLGSVSTRLLELAPCTVIVVR